MPHVYTLEENYEDIADAIREKLGVQTTYKPGEMAAAISSISGGGSTDNNWAEVMRHESTDLYDNEITYLAEYQLGTGTLTGNWITSISFPELTTAGGDAFRQQTSVTSMNLPRLATLGSSGIFYRMTALQSIALPSLSTPTRIDLKNTFQLCSALTKVDLGSNSLAFGYRLYNAVFASCSALTTLIIRCPEVVGMYNNASNNFSGTPLISGTGYIYVPSSLVNSYKGAGSTKWGAFSSQIRAIEDYSDDGTVNGDIIV